MTCSRPSALLTALLWAPAIVGAVPRVRAEEPPAARAQAYLERGQRWFAEGRYAEAIVELKRGYEASRDARCLYAIGQAYRLDAKCEQALVAYRAFLSSGPTATQRTATEHHIAACIDTIRANTREEVVADPPVVSPSATPDPATSSGEHEGSTVSVSGPTGVRLAPAPDEPASRRRTPDQTRVPAHKRWWVWTTLAGVAVVGVGLGVGLGIGLRPASFDATFPEVGPGSRALTVPQIH